MKENRKREPPRPPKRRPPLLCKEGSYRSALDGMRTEVDASWRVRWIEKMGKSGKPDVFYRYDSNGRLMKYTRKLFGYEVTPAEYTRFGEDTQITVVKRKPLYDELR